MTHHHTGREVGPDGSLTLFRDLVRRLDDEYGRTVYIGAPEMQDNGDIACSAVLFTALNRYTLHAVQTAAGRPSVFFCDRESRVTPANPTRTLIDRLSDNLLDPGGDEITVEAFNRLLTAIIRAELVVLDTARNSALDVAHADTMAKDEPGAA